MLKQSNSFSSEKQEQDNRQESPKDFINPEQKVHALETELDGLQNLVCYLLEKNERLRTQVQALARSL